MLGNRSFRANNFQYDGVFIFSMLMVLLLCPSYDSVNAERVVCGVLSSSTARRGEYDFEFADIPTSLCTHIAYDRMEIDLFSSAHLFDNPEMEENGWKTISELRRTKPELKLLASIRSPLIMEAAAEKDSRENITESMLQYMEKWQIDGVELYWSGGIYGHGEEMFLLIEELRSRFIAAGHPAWEVIVLVEIDRKNIDYARLCRLVDYVHVLGMGERKPIYRDNSSTPVAKATFDINEHKNITLERGLQYWIDHSCPANKITLGVILLGQPFKIKNGEKPKGLTTFCSFSDGNPICLYVELCQKLKESEWTMGWDDMEGLAPHAIQGDLWIGYENEASAGLKGKIAKRKNLAGVYIISLDMDDYRSKCGTLYPLTKALIESFKSTIT